MTVMQNHTLQSISQEKDLGLFLILGCPLMHILMRKSARQIKYWDLSEEPIHFCMR